MTQITSIFATHLAQQYGVLEIDRALTDLAGDLVTPLYALTMQFNLPQRSG